MTSIVMQESKDAFHSASKYLQLSQRQSPANTCGPMHQDGTIKANIGGGKR